MSTSIINLSIKPVVLKVAKAVAKHLTGAEKARVSSFAWYNGREKGIAIVTEGLCFTDRTVVVINEHRSSDNITVDNYLSHRGDVPHHTDEGYGAAYENRAYYDFEAVEKAARAVVKILRAALKAEAVTRAERIAKHKAARLAASEA